MSGTGLKIVIGAGIAVGALGLLAFTGAPEQPREPVVLNPPPAPNWDSEWIPGAMPQPPAAEAGTPASAPPGQAAQPGGPGTAAGGQTGPVEDPYAG